MELRAPWSGELGDFLSPACSGSLTFRTRAIRIRAAVQPGTGLNVCIYYPLTGWAWQASGSGRYHTTQQGVGKLHEHWGLSALLPTGNLSA